MSDQAASKDARKQKAEAKYRELKELHPQLKEGVRLARLGFAVHWLKAGDKMPVNAKWSTAPVMGVVDLILSYRAGYNVGWRTGISKVGGYYVHVLDIDIKSSDANHAQQAFQAAAELIGENAYASSWAVETGREPGMHILIGFKDKMATVKKGLARSEDTCTVRIDGKNVQRTAWGLEFLGVGAQVVAPTSVHPDTKRQYQWHSGPQHGGQLFTFEAPLDWMSPAGEVGGTQKGETQGSGSGPEDHKMAPPVDVDLNRVSEGLRDLLVEGFGERRGGRHRRLMGLAADLIREGELSGHEVVSLLTDPLLGVSAIAKEHTKGGNRRAQMIWMDRYTYKKAMIDHEQDIERIDDAQLTGDVKLSPEEAKAQREVLNLHLPIPWRDRLQRFKNGEIKPTINNTKLALGGSLGKGIFRLNTFSRRLEVTRDLKKVHLKTTGSVNRLVLANLRSWVGRIAGFEPNKDVIEAAVDSMCLTCQYHPVEQYLFEKCGPGKWDGTPRLERVLIDYAEAEDTPLVRALAKSMFMAICYRVLKRDEEEGYRFDTVIILEGDQGTQKTELIKKFAIKEKWYTAETINLKDGRKVTETLQGKLILELGELNTLRAHDDETMKHFISKTTDEARTVYEKNQEAFRRECIFIGTTNKKHYLTDSTGSRRYRPILTGKCDPKGFEKVRDQVYAEAMEFCARGEQTHLVEELEELAKIEAAKRLAVTEFDDALGELLHKHSTHPLPNFDSQKINIRQLIEMPGSPFKDCIWSDVRHTKPIAQALAKRGYEIKKCLDANYWVPKK